MKAKEHRDPLTFGNHTDARWCAKGKHYVNKHNGGYVPVSRFNQEWQCNLCVRRENEKQEAVSPV